MTYHRIFEQPYSAWCELEKEISLLGNNDLIGDVFEQFVFVYFMLHSHLYDIKEIYREKDIPQPIREKLQLEPTDYGVDGVLINSLGEICTYQAKFRSNRVSPTYAELSTFWAESEYADKRCIISNCSSLPNPSDKKKNQFVVLVDRLEELDELFFANLRCFILDIPVEQVVKHTPLPHQIKMIDDVITGFQNHDRGKLIAACGTGKTLTALWILERLTAQTALYIVPNLSLIKQTLDEWINQACQPFKFLCVCSDRTVVDAEAYDSLNQQTTDVSFPVTTDWEEIKKFLEIETAEKKIVFSTYHSLESIVYAVLHFDEFRFDIGFFDEAHRTAGTKDTTQFVYGLEDKYIPIANRLFMTATERLVSTRIKRNLENTEYTVFSMDDEDRYGPVFTRLNFGEAIEQGIISDYRIILCCIDDDFVKNSIIDNLYLSTDGINHNTAENLFLQSLLAVCFRDQAITKVITFHNKIEAAESFIDGNVRNTTCLKDVFKAIAPQIENNISTQHINGTMTAKKRHQIIREFEKSQYAVLSNARCLTEGVDVPIIDAVYFASPKNSIIDIIQAIGRALRKSINNNDKVSSIIIPVPLPNDCMSIDEMDFESFETLHNVVQALRDQDTKLAEIINGLNLQAARTGRSTFNRNLSDKLKVIIPPRIDFSEFADSLSIRIATVNKDPETAEPKFVLSANEKPRQGGVARCVRTLGDYNREAYKNELVVPTINRFHSADSSMQHKHIVINHNNVSHTVKLGLIRAQNRAYHLTEIGKLVFHDIATFNEVFNEQMLKYYEVLENKEIIYSYRALLKLLVNFDSLTRFEFMFGFYSLRGTTNDYIEEGIGRVQYLRDTYPGIELLSSENKITVLEMLNSEFNVNFNYADVWTSRTTAYNQYNYFKQHLACLDNVIDLDQSTSKTIVKAKGADALIQAYLTATDVIETCSESDLDVLYTTKIT